MKRVILFIAVLSLISSGIFAQSLALKLEDNIVSNDTVYMMGNITDDLMELHLKVQNRTDKEIEVKVRKKEISIIEETVNTFCWGGSCFFSTVYTSPSSTIIGANGTDSNSFAGYYEPSGVLGTSIISYTFFNVQNEEDSVMVTVFFQAGATGIDKINYGGDELKIFPNPIVDRINIEFNNIPENPYTIRLLNLNGQLIQELINNSTSKSHRIDLGRLPSSYAIIEITDSKGLAIHRKVLIGE